jgi:predicted Zn-dependent protease with MMP-like domain
LLFDLLDFLLAHPEVVADLVDQGLGDRDHQVVVVAIAETLIHEIGHYFGMSEQEIEEIEEQYWRADDPRP